jgi:metal-responsive CopG/Arc/MetJ family transcriptional regulator
MKNGMKRSAMKTAISLEESLFEKVDALAQTMQISRSRLFAIAVEEYIERHQNQKLLEAINAAFEPLDTAEQEMLDKIRPYHQQLVEGQW